MPCKESLLLPSWSTVHQEEGQRLGTWRVPNAIRTDCPCLHDKLFWHCDTNVSSTKFPSKNCIVELQNKVLQICQLCVKYTLMVGCTHRCKWAQLAHHSYKSARLVRSWGEGYVLRAFMFQILKNDFIVGHGESGNQKSDSALLAWSSKIWMELLFPSLRHSTDS